MCLIGAALLVALPLAEGARAQTESDAASSQDAASMEGAEAREPFLRVAVLPFEYVESSNSRIGWRVAELLSEALGLNPDWEIVGPESVRDRSRRTLPRMTALVQGDAAAELGEEVGVDAVITGQIYALDGRFYLVAKLVGCRSRKVFGAGADASSASSLSDVMTALAEGLDHLLAERRHALASPTPRLRSVEEALKTQVTVLRRQRELPPVIVLVADMEEMLPVADEAIRRLVQRVRRTGMSAQSPKAKDLVEWVRSLHAQAARGVPEALEGNAIVLAVLLQTEAGPDLEGVGLEDSPVGEGGEIVEQNGGPLRVGHGLAEAIWLDARDGAELGRGRAERYALGQGPEQAGAAVARVLAQEIFETSLGEVIVRWEARRAAADEKDLRAAAGEVATP
ncbi:MAG: hypothetical protein V3S71_07115 [Acidobacteriota bacterium]